MTQHLYVDEPDQELFQEALVQPGILQPRLEGLDFLSHDAVLLRLALALSDGPYEGVELSGPCWALFAD